MNFIIRHFNIKWRTTKAAAATGNVVLIILFNESAGMGGGEELTGSDRGAVVALGVNRGNDWARLYSYYNYIALAVAARE